LVFGLAVVEVVVARYIVDVVELLVLVLLWVEMVAVAVVEGVGYWWGDHAEITEKQDVLVRFLEYVNV
jgi:hypothetical protein